MKKSKFFGKQKLFVWTNDDVIVKKFNEPKKEQKPYKNEPLLVKDDFKRLGIPSENIAQFYQSDFNKKIKRLQDRFVENPNKFDMFKEEALRLLSEWIKTQNFRF